MNHDAKIHGTLVVDTQNSGLTFLATLYMVVAAPFQWLQSLSSICACLRRNVGSVAFLQTCHPTASFQSTEHLTQTGNQASRHPKRCPWREIFIRRARCPASTCNECLLVVTPAFCKYHHSPQRGKPVQSPVSPTISNNCEHP